MDVERITPRVLLIKQPDCRKSSQNRKGVCVALSCFPADIRKQTVRFGSFSSPPPVIFCTDGSKAKESTQITFWSLFSPRGARVAIGGLCTLGHIVRIVNRDFCKPRGAFQAMGYRSRSLEADLSKPHIKMFRDELVIVQMGIGSIDAINLLSLSAT